MAAKRPKARAQKSAKRGRDRVNLEGIDRRIRKTHKDIPLADSSALRSKERVIDLPQPSLNVAPPRAIVTQIKNDDANAFLCGQRYIVTPESGPKRGLPVSLFCAEPLCATAGKCTGTRFVPHMEQYTSTNQLIARPRKLSRGEIVQAVRFAARQASRQTGRDEDRTDKEIIDFVKLVWAKMLGAVRGGEAKDWRRV